MLAILPAIPLLIAVCFGSFPAPARYGGGTGEPNDPYMIGTAADLLLLGESRKDYDKHFILTADIDLDPNLPGRKIFDKAVIAWVTGDPNVGFQGTEFSGVFDGNGHTISHLTISGKSWLGLFGELTTGARISNLHLEDVLVIGTDEFIGGLVGRNESRIDYGGRRHLGAVVSNCSSTGTVSGNRSVGGLVGNNEGTITKSHTTGVVTGNRYTIGGLVGSNHYGSVTKSYSAANVTGNENVGGLAGGNYGSITMSYASGTVSGNADIGGLVGRGNFLGSITMSYSTANVSGNRRVGGLVGSGMRNFVTDSFWNVETSGQTLSEGGTSKTTAEMQTAGTFLEAGWDFVDETENGTEDVWCILEGQDYPRLWWELAP